MEKTMEAAYQEGLCKSYRLGAMEERERILAILEQARTLESSGTFVAEHYDGNEPNTARFFLQDFIGTLIKQVNEGK